MFIDLLSKSCEEGNEGISLFGNKDEPIFGGYVLPISLNFWLSFTRCMIKIFRWGRVGGWGGGSSEGCLKWGGGGH